MNYFSNMMREHQGKFWLYVAWISLGFLGMLDFITSVFGGNVIKMFVIVTILGIIGLIVYKAASKQKNKQRTKVVEAKAAIFEPKAEGEIRRKIAKNPEFATLCYECVHFNHEKLHCFRKMADERVKEVRINDKKYCLYWSPQRGRA